CGKSNLYRAMYLIAAAASGQFARTLAEEGGMPSVLWAGAQSKNERKRLVLHVRLSELEYKLICGLPIPSESAFTLDPEIKREEIHFRKGASRVRLLIRRGGNVTACDADGKRISFPLMVSSSESILSNLIEPHKFPEISRLRQEILGWRFYHQFRTDPGAPSRHPQIGVRTPVLSHDGSDLAAALQTIREIGDVERLERSVHHAFPGASLGTGGRSGEFTVSMSMPGFHRPFAAKELSDGTLQYLCLLAALLSPRPPGMMALNEPETSIHPDLYEPLARLIADASTRTQVWITTHSRALSDYLLDLTGETPIELTKVGGATKIVGANIAGEFEDDDDDDD
ncbi:MAG TPA: AAA family ATPase, partial [Chroococcales cyanobacterium]